MATTQIASRGPDHRADHAELRWGTLLVISFAFTVLIVAFLMIFNTGMQFARSVFFGLETLLKHDEQL
ncbi:MAG: hypothetical protein H7228_03570 [Polaromonas sp.]|nr:hypothetical protein [Polaromonas sp.]